MAKFGKKYVEAAKKVDRTKTYSVAEAVKLAKETNIAKFDASVEVSFKLNVDPRHADQQIRGAMVLPHGTGKTQKVGDNEWQHIANTCQQCPFYFTKFFFHDFFRPPK